MPSKKGRHLIAGRKDVKMDRLLGAGDARRGKGLLMPVADGSTPRGRGCRPVSGRHHGIRWRALAVAAVLTVVAGCGTGSLSSDSSLTPTPTTAGPNGNAGPPAVSYTHLRAHETVLDLVCRL